MNRFVSVVCVLCLAPQVAAAQGVTSQSAMAQNATFDAQSQPAASEVVTSAAPATTGTQIAPSVDPAGPTMTASRAGIAPKVSNDVINHAAVADPHMGAGQNIALMIVGGAGLITGLLIGGGAGAAVAIAGAAVGLVGLYGYVK